MLRIATLAAVVLIAASGSRGGDAPGMGVNWPGFRGQRGQGRSEGFATPLHWDVPSGKNIRWITPIPGLGHSSPVVWGDRIFLTTAVRMAGDDVFRPGFYGDIASVEDQGKHRWLLLCVEKQGGKLLWQREVHAGVPHMKRHPKSSHANPSPATDGRRVVVMFGSEGLFCYSMAGDLFWKRNLGRLDSGFFKDVSAQWGFASSPVIHDDLVIVQCDVQQNSFLAAFRIEDGRPIWRTPRDDVPTWSTPTVDVRSGRAQVLVNGHRHIGGYDLKTGKVLWRMQGGGDIPIPTPVVGHGLVFITSAHGGPAPVYAIRLDATGDITPSEVADKAPHIAWSVPRRGNYQQTPVLVGDHLYLCNHGGVLSCYRAVNGERLYRERLDVRSTWTASPVSADGKLYCAAENGKVVVVKTGPDYQVMATNDLGDTCLATPAISEGRLYFRTRSNLIAVGE